MTTITRRTLLRAGTGALAGTVALSRRATAGQPATPAPGGTDGYANPGMLATPADLAAAFGDPALRVVALTEAESYAAGHLPGAVQVDWPAFEVTDTSAASIAGWEETVRGILGGLGISRDSDVVVYDGGTLFAARLWWVLDYFGHERARILDGGLPTWVAAGEEIASGATTAAATPAAAAPYQGSPVPDRLATLQEVVESLGRPDLAIVDARTPDEFAAGHIPGAVNINYPLNARPDDPKTYRPAGELLALYAERGVTPDKLVVPYCSTGVRSAVTYSALRLLGYERVALYTGSWAEWGNHPETPKDP